MKKSIKRKMYDTDTAKQINFKYVGEYGEANGYEERLYITKRNLYFIYGIGGPESPYPQETITPVTKEQADAWDAEIPKEKEKAVSASKKPGKSKAPAKKAAAKKAAKAAVAEAAEVPAVSSDADPVIVKDAEITEDTQA